MVHDILKTTVAPIIRGFIKEVTGVENIPKDKAFIIACNHVSYYDDVAIPSLILPAIDKKIHFYASHKYFKNYFLRKILEYGECIEVDASKNKKSKKMNKESFKKALYYLKKNEPVAIFPEGTRSLDGNLQRAKTGIAYLVLKARVPVLPIGIKGSNKILPKGSFFPKPRRCAVKIGKLMYFDKHYGKKINKKLLTKITNDIMRQIAKLTNQKYRF